MDEAQLTPLSQQQDFNSGSFFLNTFYMDLCIDLYDRESIYILRVLHVPDMNHLK